MIAPLDWGMGHTTRCVPVMRHLQSAGHHIVFAGNEWQQKFIKESFTDIENIHLEGYDIHYGEGSFIAALLPQLPQIGKAIKKEHEWLKEAIDKWQIDAVIADNRYGLNNPSIPCVIMTHQLALQSGMGSIMDSIARKAIYGYLERFATQWVVDVAGENNLSGKLGHPDNMPNNAKYIGLLSQMQPASTQNSDGHLLVLLSGPEPQRTILEQILWEQVKNDDSRKVVFVLGTDAGSLPNEVPGHIKHYNRIASATLLPLMEAAGMVICRSGYSSVMDLVRLGKKAVLIPTPGQTEQEYLAKHLHRAGMYYTMPQKHFNLQKALQEAASFPFENPLAAGAFDVHKNEVDTWLNKL